MACSWIFFCVKPRTHTWWSSQGLGGDLGCDHLLVPHSLSFNKPTPHGLVNLYQRELSWVRAPKKKQLCSLPSTTANRAPQQPVKRCSVPLLQRSQVSDQRLHCKWDPGSFPWSYAVLCSEKFHVFHCIQNKRETCPNQPLQCHLSWAPA